MKKTALTLTGFLLVMMVVARPELKSDELNSAPSETPKGTVGPYYFSTTLTGDFDTIVARVTAALKSEGFGVVSTIDLQEKFKEKLGIDYPKYLILGACNPGFAQKALEVENKIGTMLPCNVIIRETGRNEYEIAGVDPVASMMSIENDKLIEIATQVRAKMQAVIDKL